MKAANFRVSVLMPRWGYNTNPKRPIYNYELLVRGGDAVYQRMDFVGTPEEAWGVANQLRELVLIREGVDA